jgi:hypothetical protein
VMGCSPQTKTLPAEALSRIGVAAIDTGAVRESGSTPIDVGPNRPQVVERSRRSKMTFECPWGCAPGKYDKSIVTTTRSHETAWNCPYYSTVFLGAIQQLGMAVRPPRVERRTPHARVRRSDRSVTSPIELRPVPSA